MNKVVPGKYRHYKGNCYHVISVAKHSETLEDMVLYRALYGEKQHWVRPLRMFVEEVFVPVLDEENRWKKVPRFSFEKWGEDGKSE